MKKLYSKTALAILLIGVSPALFGQAGVAINLSGSTSANPAILDLSDPSNAHLGFLMTNVSLLSGTDIVTIPSPTTGMIVWNTNAAMPFGVGYYYWTGAQWDYLYNSGTPSGVTSVTGTAPIVITGTPAIPNVNLEGTNGGVFYGTGAGSAVTAGGAQGSMLYNSAANTPAWLSVGGNGTILISNGTTPTWLPVGTNGQVLTLVAGVPTWQNASGGGVTSVSAGTSGANSGGGLTFSSNPITATGSIAIANTGVTAGTYGSTSIVPQITINAQGQITSETDQIITPASIGMLNLTQGTGITAFTYNGSSAQTVGIANTGVTAGTYGTTSIVPQITVNAQGQITSETNQTITPASIGMANLTQGTGMIPFTYNGSSAQTTGIANTGVIAGTYGNATTIPTYTVNAQGQLTGEADVPICRIRNA